MTLRSVFGVLSVALLLVGQDAHGEPASPLVVGFEGAAAGDAPPGFTSTVTGRGAPARWVVQEEPGAPSGTKVLMQESTDATGSRFPLCIYDAVTTTDGTFSVRFKPVGGTADQAAGIVWRYQTPENYYLVRANALENNVVLYKVENGKRSDLQPVGSGLFSYGKKAAVETGRWQTLAVDVHGSRFGVSLNGEHLFDVEDDTFRGAGKVGLWTKADSVTAFDDLTIASPAPGGSGACAYVTDFGGDDICALHLPEGERIGCVEVGPKPHGIALSADGQRVFVSSEEANTVTAVDATSLRVTTTLSVGKQPNQIALAPGDEQLWVTNNGDGTLSILDTDPLGVVATVPAGRGPHVIAPDASRNAAVVTAEGDGALDLFDLKTFERVSHISVFGFPRVFAVSPRGDVAFLTLRWLHGALVVDLASKQVRALVPLGEAGFAPEGKDAHGIALTSDGGTLLVASQVTGELAVFSGGDLSLRGRIAVCRNPNWVGVTPDDRHAAVSCTDDNAVAIIELDPLRVLRTVPVGREPKRLVVGHCPKPRAVSTTTSRTDARAT